MSKNEKSFLLFATPHTLALGRASFVWGIHCLEKKLAPRGMLSIGSLNLIKHPAVDKVGLVGFWPTTKNFVDCE